MQKGLISNKLRSVITLVDKLRDINLESYITLPKIAAVGSQSSGKSSIIEQIVGLDFLPRGSGVVTRRPLQIRMIYEKDLKIPYAQFVEIPQKLTDFSKVKQNIQKLTDKVCGTKKNIIDKPITLDIYSSNCPNLTIIDLPGLTRIPIDGQDSNIHQITSNIIKKYMEQPSTIILCVISANEDITNDQVLHMARNIDKFGERTIGCITKIDIMDRGTDARNLLLNKGEVPLKLGYIGIKNRSQADINDKLTVQQSLQAEKMFFSKSPIYSSLPTSVLGTTSLANKLTTVLTQSICKFLPALIDKIKQRKLQLSQIVKTYGKPLPRTQKQKMSYLWEICSEFVKEYKKCLVGQISTLQCKDNLLKTSSHMQSQLYQCLQEQNNNQINNLLTDNKIQFAIRKFDGCNMPGFPSISSFLYLLHPLLVQIKLPIIQHTLDHTFDKLSHIVDLITNQVSYQYLQFKKYLNDKITSILNKYRKNSKHFIQSMMQAEFNYIYTNNPNFIQYLQNNKQLKKQTQTTNTKNVMVPILKKRIDAYYKVVIKNLRDLVPKNIQYTLFVQATKEIQFQIFQIMTENDKLDQFLEIDQNKKNQRMKNQEEYAILCKAEEYILTQSGLSSYKQININYKNKLQQRQQQIDEVNQKRKLKLEEKNLQQSKQNQQDKPKHMDKVKSQSNLNKQQHPKQKSVNKINETDKITSDSNNNKTQNQNLIQNFFGTTKDNKKQQVKQINKMNNNNKSTPENQQNRTQQNKKVGLFGKFMKKTEPSTPTTPDQRIHKNLSANLTQTYNNEMGKTTDKAVDNLYANEKFKQKSKQAVTDGTTIAVQKQFGISQQNAKIVGKNTGAIFGTDTVQNFLKNQTKKNVRQQTQLNNK